VRVAVGDGRSRPVRVRRRGSSSAARSPAYPGRIDQSNRSESFTRDQGRSVREELKNGSPESSVHARGRATEVRRGRSWPSGEVLPGPRAGKASQADGEANRAAGTAWK
jgi:hypothetical protein